MKRTFQHLLLIAFAALVICMATAQNAPMVDGGDPPPDPPQCPGSPLCKP